MNLRPGALLLKGCGATTQRSACRAAAGATAKADVRPRMASTAPDSPRSLPPAAPAEPVPCSRAHPATRVPRAMLRGARMRQTADNVTTKFDIDQSEAAK